jgi:hypothetical protein
MENTFNFKTMRDNYNNGMLKDHNDCKNYISQFFTPLMNGTHALIENGQVSIVQDEIFNKVYMKRFEKDVIAWYNKETIPKKLICDVTKDPVGDDFINISKTMKHKYEPYDKIPQEYKDGVQLMLQYIKEVWANNNEIVFDYLIKWLANVTKGKKNKSCIYAKALQGVGKSTLPEFLRDWVLGREITTKGKADHLKGEHNLQLLGRVLVYFEELQFFSDKEWNAIDSELKDMITDDWGSYTDKYEKRFEADNINSYMVITNSALKGINGRRYLVLDLLSKYLDDFQYYGNLRKVCFNDEVGKAFYCYLKEIDTENFNSLDLPETKNKMEIIAELLTPLEKFLKFNFVLRNASIDMKVKDIHQAFKRFDIRNENTSVQRFCTLMRELGFEYKKLNGYSVYRILNEELQKIAQKRKWLHDLDSSDENYYKTECMFKNVKEDVEEDVECVDKAVVFRAEEHKEVTDKLEKEIYSVKESIECYRDDLNNACEYIKQLEKILKQNNHFYARKEKEFQPTKTEKEQQLIQEKEFQLTKKEKEQQLIHELDSSLNKTAPQKEQCMFKPKKMIDPNEEEDDDMEFEFNF